MLHAINRLSYGPRPGDIERVQQMGVEAYIEEQLHPETIPLPSNLVQKLDALPALNASMLDLLKSFFEKDRYPVPPGAKKRTESARRDVVVARYMRALASPRQLEEVMVDFWFNHFNVYIANAKKNWVASYEQTAIRPHIWGNFRELLEATAKHPAMLYYLDNWLNTAPNSPSSSDLFQGLNENYARELLELHTLGVDGGYTQQDVEALARILTGWSILRMNNNPEVQRAVDLHHQNDENSTFPGFVFNDFRHDTSNKVFLGISIIGSGIEEGEKVLDILASHPSTARHISYKLAQYFVADLPPPALVDRLAQRFLQTDGNLREVMSTLLHSSEFWDPQYYGSKFKTPYEYCISALRAAGSTPKNPVRNFENRDIARWLRRMGMPLYGSRAPTGYPNTQEEWLNSDAMLKRTDLANALGRRVAVETIDQSIGSMLSSDTQAVIAQKPPQWRGALMLGSPEMLYR
ncbi:MAG: DUF1800 domain-containing protein [Synechococcus sp.]